MNNFFSYLCFRHTQKHFLLIKKLKCSFLILVFYNLLNLYYLKIINKAPKNIQDLNLSILESNIKIIFMFNVLVRVKKHLFLP